MSATVFLAVLAAAAMHAAWNALVRVGASKATVMVILTAAQGAIGALAIPFYGWPTGDMLIWLAASGFFHTCYVTFLMLAYEVGDLSRVYPIARGTAPLILLGLGVLGLGEALSPGETLGVVILGAGILLMARGALGDPGGRRLLPFALLAACSTAGYSLTDGTGARVAGDALHFVVWMFAIDAVLFMPVALWMRGREVFSASAGVWGMGAVAGIFSFGAYAVAVWAMTRAPIALVAALRETSILFAVLIGWLAFGERLDRGKAVAAALIVAGVMVTRF